MNFRHVSIYDLTALFLVGVMLGIVAGALIAHKLSPSKIGTPTIAECEAELPRNQHCELTAVPVEKSDDE